MNSGKLLRSYIKLIVEAAVNAQGAAGEGLALLIAKNTMVLYNPKFFAKLIEEKGVENVAWDGTKGVLGYIKLVPSKFSGCWDAAEVAASAAVKGYGPLMYDIAMSMSGSPIMPDRTTLSTKAAAVWDFYDKKRSDVKKMPLDNIDDPKTPDEKDDCMVWDCSRYGGGDGTECAVNKAYTGANVDASALVNNHKKFVQSIDDGEYFEKELFWAGQAFFDERYNG